MGTDTPPLSLSPSLSVGTDTLYGDTLRRHSLRGQTLPLGGGSRGAAAMGTDTPSPRQGDRHSLPAGTDTLWGLWDWGAAMGTDTFHSLWGQTLSTLLSTANGSTFS